jgi:hypothetical protein
MRRREIALGANVFDLGLEEFDKAVVQEKQRSRMFDLEVGPAAFQCRVSLTDRAFIMHWAGRTSLANIIWSRFIAFRLKWPPITSISCFTCTWEMGEHLNNQAKRHESIPP